MLGTLFDVAIIGTELAGLVAGALLVKRGFQVLVIDVESERVQVRRNDYTLKPFPGLFFGFGQGQVFQEIFQELGIPFLEKKRFELADPAYQIALPDVRLDIPQGTDEWTKLLSVEFKADAHQMIALLNEANRYASVVRGLFANEVVYPAHKLRERYRLNRAFSQLGSDFKEGARLSHADFMAQFELSPAGRAFLEAQHHFLATIYPDEMSLFFSAMIFSYIDKGIYTVEGGLQVLENLCKERISSYRGQLQRAGEIEAIDFARINEIKLAGVKDPVRTKKILVSTNIGDFLERFAPKNMKGSFQEKVDTPPPRRHAFTLYVAIDEQVVPVGMRENVILVSDAEQPISSRNLAFVKLSPAGNTEYAPVDRRLVSMTVIVDPSHGELDAAGARRLGKHMHGRLRDLIPFLDDYTDFVAYDESFALYQALRRTVAEPAIDPEDRLGIAALPNRTPHKEVFYAGRGTLPGLGMEGEGLSALMAANLLTRALAK
ncbi:MAG: hypothetical protein P9L99_19080 [Candidatus Lernaella stagnicola]|nr:hypothetical protein [Candidatus Lernaella stagnicola]